MRTGNDVSMKENKAELIRHRARLVSAEQAMSTLAEERRQLGKSIAIVDRELAILRANGINGAKRKALINERQRIQEKILSFKKQILTHSDERDAIRELLIGTSEDPRMTTRSGNPRANRAENYKAAESFKELKDLLIKADELLWGEVNKGVVFRDTEKSMIQNIHQRCMTLKREEG